MDIYGVAKSMATQEDRLNILLIPAFLAMRPTFILCQNLHGFICTLVSRSDTQLAGHSQVTTHFADLLTVRCVWWWTHNDCHTTMWFTHQILTKKKKKWTQNDIFQNNIHISLKGDVDIILNMSFWNTFSSLISSAFSVYCSLTLKSMPQCHH